MKHSSFFCGVVAWLALAGVALAQQNPAPEPTGAWHMMHDWGMGWGGGGMILGPLFMALWLVVLIAIIVGVVRWLGPNGERISRTPTARDILDERYARGEIDRDEYLKRKQDMAGDR